MDILVSRTLYMSCQAGPGIEPGPSALKASDLPIELNSMLSLIKIHDTLPSSNHLPSSACIDIPLVPPSSCSRKSLRMTF